MIVLNLEQLESVKKEIDELLTSVYDTIDKLTLAKGQIETGVIINGKTLDDGKIAEDLKELESMVQNLTTVREHCNEKISLLQSK